MAGQTPDDEIAAAETEPAAEETAFILEQDKRLSESLIWHLQENFFDKQGINSWRDGIVPHYITSNAFIADAYARVVFGFLRDCTPPDRSRPVYIVELGCGHGRFAFHFLKKFKDLHSRSPLKETPFKYIMSDTSERNIEFWRTHEKFQPYLEEGLLDFARFDPARGQELKLMHGGETLSAESIAHPMVFISNYFFDGIPHDAFHIKDGKLHESLVTVSSPQEEPDPSDPEIIGRMKLSYEHRPAEVDYYDDPEWNNILRRYTDRLAETAFLFPAGALECIANLRRLAGGGMLLISADQGASREDELQGCEEVGLAVHGSFSFRVNYHALGEYASAAGGAALLPRHRANSLVVSAFLFGDHPGGFVETRRAYEGSVESFGPDDFFVLKNAIRDNLGNYSLEQLLAFVRLSCFDAAILMNCFPAMLPLLNDASEIQKRETYNLIHKVWETYYSFGESTDVPFHLAGLLCQMRYYREALEFFDLSVKEYGYSPGTYFNMALCHVGLREMDRALECVHKALEMEPDFDPARGLRVQLESATD
ncbi:MAG: SAM-dependent methyltransferase [Candidatus Zixiibacteriota bacterium]|nr:MAG: SAM-dependent methyltransferase [candidate division Zixibacteria bacterium]